MVQFDLERVMANIDLQISIDFFRVDVDVEKGGFFKNV